MSLAPVRQMCERCCRFAGNVKELCVHLFCRAGWGGEDVDENITTISNCPGVPLPVDIGKPIAKTGLGVLKPAIELSSLVAETSQARAQQRGVRDECAS